MLVEVARRLESRLREGDTLARLGGDEFAVLCEDSDEVAARLVAERVIDAFAKPFEIGDREVHQAASIGVALQPRDGRTMDPEQVLRWADLAMYRAKAAGNSRYAMFEGWMGDDHPDRSGLEKELRRGLADGELTVHYQPEVDLTSGRVTGAEALVRWQHPEAGPAGACPVHIRRRGQRPDRRHRRLRAVAGMPRGRALAPAARRRRSPS